MKEIFIERNQKLLRIAIRKNEKLQDCYVEEENNNPKIGEIYKGVIQNIVPAIKCAFIDIGYNKNCYMQLESKNNKCIYKKGDEVLVEIIKEDVDKKGPKITTKISIPGTYVVLTTKHNLVEISSKINDNDFKTTIKELIDKPKDIGIVIRTKAVNTSIESLNVEIKELYSIYSNIVKRFNYSNKIGLLYSDEGILSRTLRNAIDGSSTKFIVNNEEDYLYCKETLEKLPFSDYNIEMYNGALSLFDYYNIEKEVLAFRNSKISLPSGGNIVVEQTEAMYVIDVNSAKNVKSYNFRETALNTNLEAAKVIAEQIRLRNMGGIILVDFIDMKEEKDKEIVLKVLKDGFKDDKNNPQVYPFTELNLVQISRKRYGKSIYDYVLEPCHTCRGKGNKIKLSYLANIIKSKVARIKQEQGVKDIFIEMDDIYEVEIKSNIIEFISLIDCFDKNVYIGFLPHLDRVKVEPIIFANQKRNFETLRIYSADKTIS